MKHGSVRNNERFIHSQKRYLADRSDHLRQLNQLRFGDDEIMRRRAYLEEQLIVKPFWRDVEKLDPAVPQVVFDHR